MMVVHSFSDKESPNWDDYQAFAKLLTGKEPPKNAIVFCKKLSDIDLYIGWVDGEPEYLQS
ncbi:hypothetical protein FACS189454_05430 [Planctomycetales bacterium]|nr:hypothetical protein FACS189454_05430 [Planctomycetales bacterium]